MLRLPTSIATFVALLFFTHGACAAELRFKVLETKAHDANSFTQGLFYENGKLYESSGLYQRSFLHIYDADTGETFRKQALPSEIFAEGLAKLNSELYLLTWRKGILFRLRPDTLKTTRTQRYKGEGWGITSVNGELVMSNGSHKLSFRDRESFKELRQLAVLHQGKAVRALNELEFDGTDLWANQWQSTKIYKIDPKTGTVKGFVDLRALTPQDLRSPSQDVLNGIAYVPDKKAFWVTGKFWPKRYLIAIEPNDGV